MTNKRSMILGILLSLVIVTLMTFSLTYARYSDEVEPDGVISGDLEYIVSNEVEIKSVDEFFAAIENGYTNIKIDDSVDNPLIITGGVSDVNSDLTIDLNGHELQRNNREPVLNVTNGVRLTIIDSKGGGGFYNPVGSVLRISGGTLTVAAGIFESGPRTGYAYTEPGAGEVATRFRSEYAAGSGNSWSTPAGAQITGVNSVIYYAANLEDGTYTEQGSVSMPVIQPNISQSTVTGENGQLVRRVNGNMYFDRSSGTPAGLSGDTYLYFTIAGANVENTNMAATDKSADFYYTYYVTENAGGTAYVYAADQTSAPDPENGRYLVTVYGYEDVKESANPDSEAISLPTVPPEYAAIQMNSGNLYVRGGRYTSYFGEENTYCVQATGGYMAVEQGGFEALGSGVCVGIAYEQTENGDYLRVADGSFYSQVGDTIRVSNGRMEVAGGSFEKETENLSGTHALGANGAAIRISGGILEMNGREEIMFDLTGSYMYGILSEASADDTASSATVSNASFTFNENIGNGQYGTHNYGIYSVGNLTCNDVSFTVNGGYSSGILATGGKVQIGGSAFHCTVNCHDGALSSTAISAEGGEVVIASAQTTIETDGLGITSRAPVGSLLSEGSKISLEGEVTLTSSRGTAIYMSGGSLTVSGTADITSTIKENAWVAPPDLASGSPVGEPIAEIYNGIYLQGGSLDASQGTLNVRHEGKPSSGETTGGFDTYQNYAIRSFAVRVETGSVTIAKGEITNKVGGGVYVSGTGNVFLGENGNTTPEGVLSVRVEDNETVNKSWVFETPVRPADGMAANWAYRLNRYGGPAVEVNGGYLHIYNGTYTTQQGDGIIIRNGEALIQNGYFYGNDSYEPVNEDAIAGPGASYALKVYGGTINVTGGVFGRSSATGAISNGNGAFVMGIISGSNVNWGIANIYGGTFQVNGVSGFSVYQYARLTFEESGAYTSDKQEDNGTYRGGEIYVEGESTGIAIEESHSTSSSVTINGGTYYGRNDNGIWYGNGSVALTIVDGNFEGGNRSGLFFQTEPGTNALGTGANNVQISGGEFIGNPLAQSLTLDSDFWYNGAIAGGNKTRNIFGVPTYYDDVEIGMSTIIIEMPVYCYSDRNAVGTATYTYNSASGNGIHLTTAHYAKVSVGEMASD